MLFLIIKLTFVCLVTYKLLWLSLFSIQACSGICSIYPTRLAPVPQNEMSTLLNVRSKSKDIAVGSWARVKNGKYKGDLAQVICLCC